MIGTYYSKQKVLRYITGRLLNATVKAAVKDFKLGTYGLSEKYASSIEHAIYRSSSFFAKNKMNKNEKKLNFAPDYDKNLRQDFLLIRSKIFLVGSAVEVGEIA